MKLDAFLNKLITEKQYINGYPHLNKNLRDHYTWYHVYAVKCIQDIMQDAQICFKSSRKMMLHHFKFIKNSKK